MTIKDLLRWIDYTCVVYVKTRICEWVHYIETYIFSDWQFLNFLIVLVVIDSALGVYTNYKNNSLSKRLITLWFQKILIYSCYLILVHIISHFTIEGEKNQFFGWFNKVAYSALILRESIYILENMGAIRSGLIPKWIIKKLKQYDREGFFPSRQSDKERNKLHVRQ